MSCYELSFTISDGDAISIYENHLSPTLIITQSPDIVLSIEESDLDVLQNCYKFCSRTIDIGHNLVALGYTDSCISVSITIMLPQEFSNNDLHLRSYMAKFTHCELREKPSDMIIYIDCVGFNPTENKIQESILLEISHNGVCVDDFIIVIGTPSTGMTIDIT